MQFSSFCSLLFFFENLWIRGKSSLITFHPERFNFSLLVSNFQYFANLFNFRNKIKLILSNIWLLLYFVYLRSLIIYILVCCQYSELFEYTIKNIRKPYITFQRLHALEILPFSMESGRSLWSPEEVPSHGTCLIPFRKQTFLEFI